MGYGGYTQDLIDRLAKQGHPAVGALDPDDVATLVAQLRIRLEDDGTVLDLSPASLRRLEYRLVEFHTQLSSRGATLSDEQVVRLVRELTAYMGSVLVTHLGGAWQQDAPNLMRTSVYFDGPFTIVKDRHFVSPVGVNFVLGWEAAWTWDQVVDGKPIALYKLYRQARSRVIREQPSGRDTSHGRPCETAETCSGP
jgi:hypothetical protein